MLHELGIWMSTSRVTLWIATSGWIIPAAQAIHILAVGVVFASQLVLAMRVLGVTARSQPISDLQRRFAPWVWWALGILFVTGLLQILGEPKRAIVNHLFHLKMVLLLLVMALAVLFQRGVREHAPSWDRTLVLPLQARATMVGSMLVWTVMIFLGRWIAYLAWES
jgi:hypothetical protein